MPNHKCAICESPKAHLFTKEVMHKYAAEYFKCNHCGFIQVESPHWLEEAYTSAITAHDIGLLHRNIKYSEHLTMLLYSFFGTKGHYLDTAGGYGIFTRLMRDKGCDFQHTDSIARIYLLRISSKIALNIMQLRLLKSWSMSQIR